MSDKKDQITLVTSDEETFNVDKKVAERSNVKVLEYCDHHQNDPLPPSDSNDADDARRKATEISEWDAKFIQVSVSTPSFRSSDNRSTRRCSSRSSSPPTTSTSSPSCEYSYADSRLR